MRQLFVLSTLALSLSTPLFAAPDVFTKSSDYKDGEEVVGKFLVDDDYKLMIEEVERNDADFDWAWVKTADGKMKTEPKKLGFDVTTFETVTIPDVPNLHKGMLPPDFVATVKKNLIAGMEALGLKVVESDGDLTLAAAVVDYKQDSTFVYFGNVKPFVELEVRLSDKSGAVLARIRDQAHGDDAAIASFNFAEELVKFLR